MNADAQYSLRPDCLVSAGEEGVYLLPRTMDVPLHVRDTGRDIFSLLINGLTPSEIVETYVSAFHIDVEDARPAVERFVNELVRDGVVGMNDVSARPLTRLRLLMICEGNLCRSVYAQYLLDKKLSDAGVPAHVSSAGMRANPALNVPSRVALKLSRNGMDASLHTPRQFVKSMVADSDLIFTATASQRRDILRLVPQAMRRTFTLLEGAAAAEAAVEGLGRYGDPARALAAARSSIPNGTPLDIDDPYRKGDAEYDTMMETIEAASEGIVSLLRTAAG